MTWRIIMIALALLTFSASTYAQQDKHQRMTRELLAWAMGLSAG